MYDFHFRALRAMDTEQMRWWFGSTLRGFVRAAAGVRSAEFTALQSRRCIITKPTNRFRNSALLPLRILAALAAELNYRQS